MRGALFSARAIENRSPEDNARALFRVEIAATRLGTECCTGTCTKVVGVAKFCMRGPAPELKTHSTLAKRIKATAAGLRFRFVCALTLPRYRNHK